jgi:ferredoxin
MPVKDMKHKKNVSGAWYTTYTGVDEGCISCNQCYTGAPDFFRGDEDGYAYVYKQPTTPEEIALCQEQLEGCPVTSIGNDEKT